MTAPSTSTHSTHQGVRPGAWPWPHPWMCLLVLGVTLLAYGPALRSGFIWDDVAHVTREDLRSVGGLVRIWAEPGATQQYYPLLHSAFWLEHRLWGDAPLGYHLLNVLLHATAACLLAFSLRRLLSVPSPEDRDHGSAGAVPAPPGVEWIVALLFAVHPVCVESVAWVSEQKNTLSAVFYLSAAFVYLGFDLRRRPSAYWLAFGWFACALLTKSVTATLPAALLVALWWRRGRLGWRREVGPLLPWFGVGAFAGLFTAWVERFLIGAQGPDFTLPLLGRCLLAGRALWFYCGKLVWPANLIFIYPRWTIDPTSGWQYLPPAGVLAAVLGLAFLARRHRGPLAGFLFFAGTLFPALGFFNVYPFVFSYVADHFQYLASLGLLVPFSLGLAWAGRSLRVPRVEWAAGAALTLVLATLTWRQCGIYHDVGRLYRDTLDRNPECALAHNGLGALLTKVPGGLPEAIRHLREAVRLSPRDPLAHNNLGYALSQNPSDLREALAEFETAIELLPDFSGAHSNLGVALEKIPGRLPEAIRHLQLAVDIDPDFADWQDNFGSALVKLPGYTAEAVKHLEIAVRLRPASAHSQFNLGTALANLPGRLPEAIAHLEIAARLDPGSAEIQGNLGSLLAEDPRRLPDAIAHLEIAARLEPGSAQTQSNLGNALALVPGRRPDALAHFREAVRLSPDSASARHDLGKILLQEPSGLAEAILQLRAGLQLDPQSAEMHSDLGVALLQRPDGLAEALAQLETALRLNPALVQAHFVRAIALAGIPGREAESEREARAALTLNPDFQPARDWLEQQHHPAR